MSLLDDASVVVAEPGGFCLVAVLYLPVRYTATPPKNRREFEK
jgi:hypothetical protein